MKWTQQKIDELRRRYPHEDNGTLAREFGCSRKALAFRASFLGIRKTAEANEARYAALSRRAAPESMEGERRQIATGTLIVRGNVLTHLSNFSAARDQAPRRPREDGVEEGAEDVGAPATLEDAPGAIEDAASATAHACASCPLAARGAGRSARAAPASPL